MTRFEFKKTILPPNCYQNKNGEWKLNTNNRVYKEIFQYLSELIKIIHNSNVSKAKLVVTTFGTKSDSYLAITTKEELEGSIFNFIDDSNERSFDEIYKLLEAKVFKIVGLKSLINALEKKQESSDHEGRRKDINDEIKKLKEKDEYQAASKVKLKNLSKTALKAQDNEMVNHITSNLSFLELSVQNNDKHEEVKVFEINVKIKSMSKTTTELRVFQDNHSLNYLSYSIKNNNNIFTISNKSNKTNYYMFLAHALYFGKSFKISLANNDFLRGSTSSSVIEPIEIMFNDSINKIKKDLMNQLEQHTPNLTIIDI